MSKLRLSLILPLLLQPLFGETATIQGSGGGATANATVTVIIDSDRDGLTDAQEATLGTDPNNPDSDGDGLTDKVEVDAGKDPLANQFIVDPDWSSIPAATASRIKGFWDFETYNSASNAFDSRKGTHPASAVPANSSIWNQTDGMMGKSAKVGGGSGGYYLNASPSNLWTDHQNWILSFSAKFASIPTTAASLPVFSVYAGSSGQVNVEPALAIFLVYGVPTGQTGNQLFFRINGQGNLYAEWILPAGTDLTKWTDLVFAFHGTYAIESGSTKRHCYVNGVPLTLNSTSYAGVQGPAVSAGGYVIMGATKSSTGVVTICSKAFSVDRWTIASYNAGDMAYYANRDTDGDGVGDRDELAVGADPFKYEPDIDGDGLTNAEEAAGQAVFNGVTKTFGATSKTSSDTDGDSFFDYWEAKYYFAGRVDPNVATQPATVDNPATTTLNEADYDNDGLSNYQEMLNGTDPNEGDTDHDGISDKDEAEYGSDPLNKNDRQLNPLDFYGEEISGSYAPIGNLGAIIKPSGGGDSPVVSAQIGDPSGSHSEQWQLKIGDRTVGAPSYGVMSQVTPLTLDTSRYYPIKISHITTDPAWLTGEGHGEADYDYWAMVRPGEGSAFLLYDPTSLLNDPASNPESSFKDNVDPDVVEGQIAYLVPLDNISWATSYSGSDAVGPKYRKVALNGRPLADEKPQQEAESDSPDEETYIDAFNLGLHHDTSFHYMPLGSSDLALQASASTAETSFSSRSGLKPHERFDLPFGPGWSSNLCSYVEVVETLGDESDDPVAVNVIDEAGRSERFGTRNFQSFFPWPSTCSDKKTYLNTLTRNGTNFTLQKKFGNTLTYTKCKTWFMYSSDRVSGSTTVKRHTYWRLTGVRDRYGVRLQYDYDTSPGVPNDVALIPRKISSPDREGQFLVITRSSDSRRVESITDSRGNTTTFHYTAAEALPEGYPAFQKLDSVSFADQTSVGYTYDSKREDEFDASDPDNPRYTYYYHTNLNSVTDKRNNTHVFNYGFDQSKQYWDSSINGTSCPVIDELPADVRAWVEEQLQQRDSTGHGLWKTMYGQPRRVTSVVLPGGMGTTTFVPQGGIHFASTVSFPAAPSTTVTDAAGNVTLYEFSGMQAEVVDVDQTEKSFSKEWMVYYLSSSIHHGGAPGTSGYLGTETYQFDPAAGLALWRATDLSGNVTTWEFSDDHEALPTGLPAGSGTMTKWADPTAKVDALGRREDYTYGNYRVMETIDDPFDTTTAFTIDGLGRRLAKNVSQGGTSLLAKERYDYTNQRFRAFQTSKTIVAHSNVSGQAWEKDLSTAYLPDTNGRLWREVVDPTGEKLITEHAYDLNGNRISTFDPRGNRTRFEYDKLNRLTKVTYPSAGTRAGNAVTTKETWYDLNGNKAAEIDEEGHYTIHHYDVLNRRIKTIRDMDGAGLPTRNGEGLVTESTKGGATGNDLITTFEYNNVGTLIRQTDPRGFVTVTFVDAIQRPVHVFTGLTPTEASGTLAACTAVAAGSTQKSHTEYKYTDTGLILPVGGTVKGNPGGTAFDTSGFKPTEVIRHGAVLTATGTIDLHTYAQYDALYRPLRAETEYESGVYAVGTTAYGAISSGKQALESSTTDARGKVTRTVLDGLQRPVSVTDAFGSSYATTKQTVYSSTGLVWKTIDPLLRQSETEYDAVGRPVAAWQPDPATGLVNRSNTSSPVLGSACTQTGYDRNGNVAFTLNPLGLRWDYEYDARNRKTVDRQPAVTKTEIVNGVPVTTTGLRPVTTTAYDGVGTLIASTNARGHATRSFHDFAYRVTDVLSNPVTGSPSTDPQNLLTNDIRVHTSYDAIGNVLEVLDGNGNATRNTYDALNRLVTTATNPVTGQPSANPAAPSSTDITVTNSYDDAGNLVQVKDGESHLTGFRYDGLGRKTRTLWDEGSAVQRVEQATYDGVVQLTCRNARNQLTTLQYDSLNRLQNVLYAGATAQNRQLQYDLAGNLLNVLYPYETTARQTLRGTGQVFDKANRLIQETSAGATHVHTYDKAGNRLTTTYAGSGRFLASNYDSLNRLASCTEKTSVSAPTGNVTTYAYDLNGNVTRKVMPNGTATNCVFDALNRKLGETTRTSAGGLISGFDYSQAASGYPTGYDRVGNVLQIVESYGHASMRNRTVTNSYDRCYRLGVETAAETGGATVVTAYTHDAANNRTQKVVSGGSNPGTWDFAYGTTTDGYNSNQVKSVTDGGSSATAFVYDANGNRTEKKVGGTTVQTYGYDFDNRLVSLIDSVKGTFAYTYDHRTRRVGRNESAAGGASEEVSFAGGLSVQEYTTGVGTPTVEYVRGSDYGGGIGGVLYTIRDGATRSYNAYNSRGDVVSKTADTGAITWQSAYEAFGTRTQEEGNTLDRQKANTKDEDPTGLLNEGMRYRDLEFGIFLTRDPAGFVDGPNVYTYVKQNPWSGFDPDGLASVEETLKDNKISYKEAKELEFKKGEAEAILDANKITKVTSESVRKDIVERNIFGEEQIKKGTLFGDGLRWHQDWENGMSIDEVVGAETARRNQARAKQAIVREFKDEKLKGVIKVAEVMSYSIMEGSQFVIPSVGGALARLGTIATTSLMAAPAEMATNMVTVSRWGRPGLEPGDFVMKGGANRWNYLKSGKWQPGIGNKFTSFQAGEEFVVPRSSLVSPARASTATAVDKGMPGLLKEAMGQKAYIPE